ncbi:MAG: 16S rRNA (adenine(1518)-N(6)/adenine(1519)-N(6))-dimethyltransferase RsmA [Verrucomicrobiota bacterium]
MRRILAMGDIQLTKSLGQNFLHDQNQLQKIVAVAEVTSSDKVLEIGPGLGPLTELLLANANEVLAIEKDKRLVDFLCEKYASVKNLTLIHDDALDYLRRERIDWADWKLVANLPYSVASPILVELAEAPGAPKKMVATLQIEVAERLVAKADDDDYGLLSLLMQLHYEPQGWFKIPAACFFPEPDVDSACLVLNRRPVPLLNAEESVLFKKIVKRAFSQRRKMMLKLLKQDWPKEKLESAFAELNISPQERAEKVRLEQFIQLTKNL